MFELVKHFYFEAAHRLIHHKGQCGRPHGHSYCLTVRLRSETLQSSGSSTNMVMDFADLSAIVTPMIHDYFDHHDLNATLECESPTSEYIARWIYRYLKPKLQELASITLSETAVTTVTYSE